MKIKKIFTYALIGTLITSNAMPVLAYTNSIANIDATQNVTENGTSQTSVYAELGSEFTVTVPKSITLSGLSKTGTYTVSVLGDIAGKDKINVIPDETFTLNSQGLNGITASIVQDKTEWSCSEITTGSAIVGNGTINASDLTAGKWNGTFNFNIKLDEAKLEPGLYDANGVMLASWEESGIDVEKDYKLFGEENKETTGEYVLTNNYPTTTKIVLPDNITKIGSAAFARCENLTNIKIPDSVTSIGTNAFIGCSKLTSIEIPNGVTSIDFQTFYYCKSLTTITIPDSVTTIGENAFSGCTNLTSIDMPKNVISIGPGAFANCSNLTNITIPNSIISIGAGAFNNCIKLTGELIIPDSVTTIGKGAFTGCEKLTNVEISNSITNIENNVFYACTGLTSIEIPNSVTSIGDNAFSYCTGLTNINIPNSVTSIGNYAFAYCNNLTNVTIPNNIITVKNIIFIYCTNLTSVTWKGITYTDKATFNQALKDAGITTTDAWY